MILSRFRSFAETDRIACHDGKTALTFAELWRRTEAIAGYLLKTCPGKGVVAIYGDKENDMISAMLGAFKAGHPYVTIPSFYPEARIHAIIEDCRVCAVINPAAKRIPVEGLPILTAEGINALAEGEIPEIPESAYDQPGDIVCILYTSGSSGKPKGVLIDYENIAGKIAHTAIQMDGIIKAGCTRTILLASYAFSASLVCVYFKMMTQGWTIYCVPKEILQDTGALVSCMMEVQPQFFGFTPSLAERLMTDPRFTEKDIPALRFISFAGEAVSFETARAIHARFPSALLTNCFGSTEATATPFFCRIKGELLEKGEGYCPINPVDTDFGYLADENGQPLTAEGAVGEIVFNYPTVSRGYLNLPELTAKRFFTDCYGKHAYHTGDIGEIRGGYIYFRGRADNQVKIGGNRIELEEVENHLRAVDIVKAAACAVKPTENGGNLLVGFVVLNTSELSRAEAFLHIKKELKKRAETHMIPTKLIFLDALPLNDNRKLNRQALAEMVKEV